METLTNISITKLKQIFHAYFPIFLLIILPKGFLTLFIALSYILIANFVYSQRANTGIENYELFFANSLITLVVLGGYINTLNL